MAQQQQQQFMQYSAQPVTGAYPQVAGTTVDNSPYGGQPMQVVRGQPTVIYTQPVKPLKYTERDAKRALTLGVIQLTVGLLSIIFQSVAISMESSHRFSLLHTSENAGAGIWCGALFAVTGIIGIIAGKKISFSLMTSFMVMSILCSLLVWCMLGFAAANLGYVSSCKSHGIITFSNNDNYYQYFSTYYCYSGQYSTWMAMDGLMIVLAVTELGASITASAFGCRAACHCCRPIPQQQVTYMAQQPAGMYMPNQPQTVASVSYPGQQGQGYTNAGMQYGPVQGLVYPTSGQPMMTGSQAAASNQGWGLAAYSQGSGVVSPPAYTTQAQSAPDGVVGSTASTAAFDYPTKSNNLPGYDSAASQ